MITNIGENLSNGLGQVHNNVEGVNLLISGL